MDSVAPFLTYSVVCAICINILKYFERMVTVPSSFLQSSAVEQVLDIPLLYLHIVLSAAACLSVT